jgi:hypothetical protein
MALAIRISEPHLLDDLVAALSAHGCIAHRLGGDACRVVHVHAADAAEARQELQFFARAWTLAHPSVTTRVTA